MTLVRKLVDRCWVGIVLLMTNPVAAREYNFDREVLSPEDLYDLQSSGELELDDVETLLALMEHPLELNRADREALYELPRMTYELADAILAARAEREGFAGLDDLLAVDGVTPELFANFRPFLVVERVGEQALDEAQPIHGEGSANVIWDCGLWRDSAAVTKEVGKPETYTRLKVSRGDFGAGVLATYRLRTDAFWDDSKGALMSRGPSRQADLDSVYLLGEYKNWKAILGSYNVGFGQRLTFDTTSSRAPNGWEENLILYEDNAEGRVRPRPGLFGAAVTASGFDLGPGWVDTTVFASTRRQDLYQYDLWYGFDDFGGFDPFSGAKISSCQTDGNCPVGYICGTDKQCHSSRVYSVQDGGASTYSYVTLKDVFRETLFGANVTYNLDERSHFGMTAYQSTIDFEVAKEADARFSETSRFPQASSFHAFGFDGTFGFGPFDVQGEYCRSQAGGNGASIRGVWVFSRQLEMNLAGRLYDVNFENPYSRGEAAPDEAFGLRQRNERGVRWQADWKPITGVKWVSDVDLWETPYRAEHDSEGQIRWTKEPTAGSSPTRYPFQDLRVSEMVSWGVVKKVKLQARIQYDNKVLAEGGRDEFYQSGDEVGRGEKRQVEFGFSSTWVPTLILTSSLKWVWEDVAKYNNHFDQAQQLHVRAALHAWDGGVVIVAMSNWFHQTEINATGYYVDRDKPALNVYTDMSQELGWGLAGNLRLAVLHYRDNRPDRYPTHLLGKFSLEAKW